MTRRRRSGKGIVTIYWRDIPAQVTATTDTGTEKVLLHDRFQVAIDRAAVVADMTDTDIYVQQWRRETTPIVADGAAEARALAESLEESFPKPRLDAFVAAGGADPDPDPDPDPIITPAQA